MKTYEILCLRKDAWQDPYKRVGRIIGKRKSWNSNWWLSQQKAIEPIENEIFGFFFRVNKEEIAVVVAENGKGEKYLKGEMDTNTPDLLLSLPERNEGRFMKHERYPCQKYHEANRKRWLKAPRIKKQIRESPDCSVD